MKNKILLILVGGLFFFSACSKSGATGPQGPQGPQGPAGQNGLDGNANVKGSDPITVNGWTQSGNYYTASFTDQDITQNVVDHGIVEVYREYVSGGTTSWTNLPDISGINSTVFNFYTGGLTLYNQNSDGSMPADPGAITFRVVVVPSSMRKANPNVDWKNYNVVKALLSKAGKESVSTVTAATSN